MSALSLRLPESIHCHIREVAKMEGISLNQFISSAVAEKIGLDDGRLFAEQSTES